MYSMLKKCFAENYVDSLLIGEESRKQRVLIKDFNIFIYDHALHFRIKYSSSHCL